MMNRNLKIAFIESDFHEMLSVACFKAAKLVETKRFKFGRTMQLFNVCHEEKCKMYSIHTLVHEKLSN